MNDFRFNSANPPSPNSSATAVPSWSAEAGADVLMDDLFSDIDQILDGKTKPTTTAKKPEYVSLQSLVIPQIDLPAAMPPIAKENTVEEPTGPVEIRLKRGWQYYCERLVFLGSCATLLGVTLWLVVNDKLQKPQFLAGTVAPTEVKPIAQTDRSFADYVQKSLAAIDSKYSAATLPTVEVPANTVLPTTTTQTTQTPTGPQVIERIYIPVYPPNANTPEVKVSPQNVATVTPTKPGAKTPTATIPKPAIPSSQPIPLQPPTVRVPLSATLPPPPPPTTSETTNPNATTNANPKMIYTLVGVLESGDRSAALFNIDGATQRFKLGEQVGASGWKLVSVQNQNVVMSREGQTRSLYIGQKYEE